MQKNIVIIGAGEIGRAIGKIIGVKSDFQIEFWDKDESKVSNQKTFEKIIPQADFIFLCVPSWVMREAINPFIDFLKRKTIVFSFAKGIEKETKKFIPEILDELFRDNEWAIICGPMLSDELEQGKVGAGMLASKTREVYEKSLNIFDNTGLILEYSSDYMSVALASVLKNIYALGLGIAGGLSFGDNLKGYLISLAIKEMREIAILLNCDQEVILGSAGLGDLVATSFSSYSRNRENGGKIAEGKKCDTMSEGFMSLSSVTRFVGEKISDFKFLGAINSICAENRDAREIFKFLAQ